MVKVVYLQASKLDFCLIPKYQPSTIRTMDGIIENAYPYLHFEKNLINCWILIWTFGVPQLQIAYRGNNSSRGAAIL